VIRNPNGFGKIKLAIVGCSVICAALDGRYDLNGDVGAGAQISDVKGDIEGSVD